ncbi:RICIN domain-containing protein [Streptomyces sp. NBC_01314]|uniref:RICIN domain-containing protein n=1 Tax=Streptomyces sp. NBC_01314 TaxID=2903821 RepID=UPI003088236C|nr:RICIN domain-containing protein [Streptomyces sp. NBC_01314]
MSRPERGCPPDHPRSAPGVLRHREQLAGGRVHDQLFRHHPVRGRPDSVCELKNRKSGLCLGISGASTANGAVSAQFACDGSTNQGWSLITR